MSSSSGSGSKGQGRGFAKQSVVVVSTSSEREHGARSKEREALASTFASEPALELQLYYEYTGGCNPTARGCNPIAGGCNPTAIQVRTFVPHMACGVSLEAAVPPALGIAPTTRDKGCNHT